MNEIIWKDVEGFTKYEVNNLGQIRNKKTQKILKPVACASHYTVVSLNNGSKIRSLSVARIVMNAFNPTDKENLNICYKDGDKTNCSLDNLYYGEKIWHSKDSAKYKMLKLSLNNIVDSFIETWMKDDTNLSTPELKAKINTMIDFWEMTNKSN